MFLNIASSYDEKQLFLSSQIYEAKPEGFRIEISKWKQVDKMLQNVGNKNNFGWKKHRIMTQMFEHEAAIINEKWLIK